MACCRLGYPAPWEAGAELGLWPGHRWALVGTELHLAVHPALGRSREPGGCECPGQAGPAPPSLHPPLLLCYTHGVLP